MCGGGGDGEAQIEITNKGNNIPFFKVQKPSTGFELGMCHLKRKTGFWIARLKLS